MTKYLALLPIHQQVFSAGKGKWLTTVMNKPDPVGTDRVCYRLRCDLQDAAVPESRILNLSLSDVALHTDTTGNYKAVVLGLISDWLGQDNPSIDSIEYFG